MYGFAPGFRSVSELPSTPGDFVAVMHGNVATSYLTDCRSRPRVLCGMVTELSAAARAIVACSNSLVDLLIHTIPRCIRESLEVSCPSLRPYHTLEARPAGRATANLIRKRAKDCRSFCEVERSREEERVEGIEVTCTGLKYQEDDQYRDRLSLSASPSETPPKHR
jgi:hypothetical protein